jgi:hypothetical protein
MVVALSRGGIIAEGRDHFQCVIPPTRFRAGDERISTGTTPHRGLVALAQT